MGPKVFICVLNWNKRDITLACLRSLFTQNFHNFRVIVIDNGSSDGSVAALRQMRDRIDLIEHQENLGFTGGCNAAIRHALAHGGDYVWLVNNDSECRPDTLSRLVAYAEARPDVGMVSPIIADRRTGKDNYAVGRIDLGTGLCEETADAAAAQVMQDRFPAQMMLKGTALLLKRNLIEHIGLFDERFFAYCEDNDYSMRCTAAGFRVACVPDARVYHDEGSQTPDGTWRKPYAYYYSVRNGVLFWRKHARGFGAWRFARWHVCTMFHVLARSGFGAKETEAFADGLWSGLCGVHGRWEPALPGHRMPILLRRAFVAIPALTCALFEADPYSILRALRQPFSRKQAARRSS